jgi:hypothetical protein
MNMTNLIVGQLVSVSVVLSALAQGSFENMNFELANPGTFSSFSVPVSNALPYWKVSLGEVQQTDVGYNAFSTGATSVTLVGPGYGPIDGNYSVLLYGGETASSASISQTGLIPAGTQSLFFDVGTSLYSEALEVLIGNQSIPFSAVGSGPNYTRYGANISAWAGDTEQLTFWALEETSEPNEWELDDIIFSPNAVPEPSPLAMTGIGGLLFALYRRFAPKRP